MISLKLLPVELLPNLGNRTAGFAHTVLNCQEDIGDLYTSLQDLTNDWKRHVPDIFNTYLAHFGDSSPDTGYGRTYEDPYGAPLMMVKVSILLEARGWAGVQVHREKRAAWAYLAELDPEQYVALYWC